jgi:hypothetical protein
MQLEIIEKTEIASFFCGRLSTNLLKIACNSSEAALV